MVALALKLVSMLLELISTFCISRVYRSTGEPWSSSGIWKHNIAVEHYFPCKYGKDLESQTFTKSEKTRCRTEAGWLTSQFNVNEDESVSTTVGGAGGRGAVAGVMQVEKALNPLVPAAFGACIENHGLNWCTLFNLLKHEHGCQMQLYIQNCISIQTAVRSPISMQKPKTPA